MSIRLVTEDVLRLDVDVETYNRMFREIQQKLDERYGELPFGMVFLKQFSVVNN